MPNICMLQLGWFLITTRISRISYKKQIARWGSKAKEMSNSSVFFQIHLTNNTVGIIDPNKFKPSGEFVNVGDHQLHYIKKGFGGPTVVFESGLDPGGHLSWKYVQNEISKFTTTISYDRAGILWSEQGDNSKSLSSISSDLNNLLING